MNKQDKQQALKEFMVDHGLDRITLSKALGVSVATRGDGRTITPTLSSWLAPVDSKSFREVPDNIIHLLNAWDELCSLLYEVNQIEKDTPPQRIEFLPVGGVTFVDVE